MTKHWYQISLVTGTGKDRQVNLYLFIANLTAAVPPLDHQVSHLDYSQHCFTSSEDFLLKTSLIRVSGRLWSRWVVRQTDDLIGREAAGKYRPVEVSPSIQVVLFPVNRLMKDVQHLSICLWDTQTASCWFNFKLSSRKTTTLVLNYNYSASVSVHQHRQQNLPVGHRECCSSVRFHGDTANSSCQQLILQTTGDHMTKHKQI